MAPSLGELSEPTRRCLFEGMKLFNAGRWWHAHEAWEDAWRAETGTTRIWLQGLIQLAAAYHKGLRMGNPRGMASLFEACLEKLERVRREGNPYGGMDLDPVVAAAERGRNLASTWAAGGGGFDPDVIPVLEVVLS